MFTTMSIISTTKLPIWISMHHHFADQRSWKTRIPKGKREICGNILLGTHDFFSGPTTFYLGHTTFFSVPTTFFSGPTTFYPRPTTFYPRPTTLYPRPTTFYPRPTTFYPRQLASPVLAYSDLPISYIIQYYHQSPYYQQIVQNMCLLSCLKYCRV
jgi:hypothetical protein